MTKEQIKAIAKEYVYDYTENQYGRTVHTESTLKVLQWLNERFCIVEREKVIDKYRNSEFAYKHHKNDEDYAEGYWKGQVEAIESFFDTTMFNSENK